MRLFRVLGKRFRSLLRRPVVETELDHELAFHLEQLEKEYRASGMSASDARSAARRAFGSPGVTSESCRDTRRITWFEDILRDLAHGLRLLIKSPSFTATAVLSLALGIGANTAIFGLIHQVILSLLPVREPEMLVMLGRKNFERSDMTSFPHPFLRDLQTAKDLPFEGVFANTGLGRTTMLAGSSAEPVSGELVSGNYYEVLGVRPALGRLLSAADDQQPGAHPVVVLSHNFWTRRFGQDPSILNKTIRLNKQPFTVVGVMAAGFDGFNPGRAPDFQISFSMAPALDGSPRPQMLTSRTDWWLKIFARLKPGVTHEQAAAALQPMLMRHHELASDGTPLSAFRQKERDSERMLVTGAAQGGGQGKRRYERALLALAAITGAVLLIACLNIALLLLARASAREREFSVRLAIGASRTRVMRQLLTESLLLASLGALLGLGFAAGFGQLLVSMVVSDRLHSTVTASPNTISLAFNFGLAMLAGVLFGFAPGLYAARQSLTPGLKAKNSSGRLLVRKMLISVQVGLTVVLLTASGLFLQTLRQLRVMDLGFKPDRVMQVGLDAVGYAPDRVATFYRTVIERLRAIPGVSSVSAGSMRVVSGSGWGSGIRIQGKTLPDSDAGPSRDVVGANYFSTMGIPLLAGRDFSDADLADGAPKVAVVNESFARFYFGKENPLGKRIGPHGRREPEYTIVGVARDSKYAAMREESTRFWYAPYTQGNSGSARTLTIYVRTFSDPNLIAGAIRQEVARVDNSMALFDVRTIEEQIDQNLMLERLLATLSTLFGALAAALAAIGLFGVLSYTVSRQEREIGIRVALGALPWRAAWTIVRQVVVFVLAGIGAGVGVALWINTSVEKLLFGVKPGDPAAILAACAAMLIVALASTLLPARRASKVEPAVTLRND